MATNSSLMAIEVLIKEIIIEEDAAESALLEFYKTNYPIFKKILLRDIPLAMLHRIALILHRTMSNEVEWIEILNKLGVTDNDITGIEQESKSFGELPIYIALSRQLRNRSSFGSVTNVMIDSERHDVLLCIKPFVESRLDEEMGFESDQLLHTDQPTAPEFECDMADVKTVSPLKEIHQLKSNELQHRGMNFSKKCAPDKTVINYPIHQKTLSVLILFAKVDTDVAVKLSSLLREKQIDVKTLQDLDSLLRIRVANAIHALLCTVDFIVPIVSKSFLKQIHPSKNVLEKNNIFTEEEDDDGFPNDSHNQYIYQLILNEYIENKCLNFRVRAVLVPEMKRRYLKYHILLLHALRLWKSVPDFVELLRSTQLMLQS